MSLSQPIHETIIVGAGIAGLTISHYLTTQLQQSSIQIIEKSRGVGGRIATRRSSDTAALFDHGAQFYKLRPETQYVHDNVFQKYKLAHLWYQQSRNNTTEDVYCSSSMGMNNLCKHIVTDAKLQIKFNTKLIKIELVENNALWKLTYDNNETSTCNNLILTIPLPQSLDILDASNIQYDSHLKTIEYAKALVALIELDNTDTPQLGDAGQLDIDSDGIHSIIDQQAKHTSPVKAWTIVMTPSWSETHYNDNDNDNLDKIIGIVKQKYASLNITAKQLKKWRFSHSTAKPDSNRMIEIVHDKPLLMLVGDGLGGGSIAGSLRSASAAIEHFNNRKQKSAL